MQKSKSKGAFADIFAPDDQNLHAEAYRDASALVSDHDDDAQPLLPEPAAAMRHAASSSVLEMGGIDWRQSVQKPLAYRMGNSTIRFQKPLVIALLVVLALLLLAYFFLGGGSKNDRPNRVSIVADAVAASATDVYNATYPLTAPTITVKGMQYRISLVADLDTASKMAGKEDTWRSYLKQGFLYWDGAAGKVDLEWDAGDPIELRSSLALGGRGMELSELVTFNGRLYTVDDRTGVVYQVDGSKVVPWVILADGNGSETKGFKGEWCTVKDGHLYVGGLGKEWTTSDGNVINFNPMFVKRISPTGKVEHLDWHDRYISLRESAGIEFPGYMIHEAVAWSALRKRWFFLPRRASKNKYNDVDDERHGTNMLLTADDDFESLALNRVGDLETPSHGFSSFKFVPGTSDDVIVALKSEELEGKIATYIMVFKVDGTILYPETKVADLKYEGIEFV